MTADVESWPYDAVLASYLEGELPPLEAARVETALAGSPRLRLRLSQLRQIHEGLAAPLLPLEHIDLTSVVRRQIESRPARRQQREINLTTRRAVVTGALMVACVAMAWVSAERPIKYAELGRTHSDNVQVRVKGAASGSGDKRPTHTALQTYRVGPDGSAVPLTAGFSRSDGLLFSYTNVGADPYRYLTVFAVDAAKQVLWFYPAFERADSDPVSTSITGEQVQALLPDVIHHDYAVGTLDLFALFSRNPVRVSEVEHWLEQRRLDHPETLSPGSLLSSRQLEVTK